MRPRMLWLFAVLLVVALQHGVHAQGRRGQPQQAPKASAPIDLAGYWVSVITEDWRVRMVTPKKGVYEALPLNAEESVFSVMLF